LATYSTLFFGLLSLSQIAKADVFSDILNKLENQTNLQQQISQYTNVLPNMNTVLQNEYSALYQNNGHDGYGNLFFNSNLQSWGANTSNWNSVLQSYQQGGTGLGQIAQQLNEQFPIQSNTVANPNAQTINAQYYTLEAQTALASRAASQLDYNNIQNQINYMQQLQQQIDKTPDIKGALDLQNRIAVESNLIQLEVVRLTALSDQQQAIKAQGDVNSIVNISNATQ
jgi:type IV secretion system protein VirB5